MNLQEFINTYNGRAVDYDNAFGAQCTDIIKFYMRDVLYTPVTGGHAKQMLTNLNSEFTYIHQSEIPKPRDIIAWDWGKYGHVAIVISADERSITVFEQNRNNKNDPCQISIYHSYKNVQGYGRHKSLNKTLIDGIWNGERPNDVATFEEIEIMLKRKFGENADFFEILHQKRPHIIRDGSRPAIYFTRAMIGNNIISIPILSRLQTANEIIHW